MNGKSRNVRESDEVKQGDRNGHLRQAVFAGGVFCGAGNGGIDSKYYYINEEIRVEYGRKVQNF